MATGVHEAPETLSRSVALRHHDQMQTNAVSQGVVWVLVPRSLNYRVSDAVSMGGRRRNRGASVSGADGVHAASETLSNSFAQRHHARMLATAVSQRAAWVLMLRSLIYSVSNAYRWAAGAEYPAHMFWRQVGCLQRMGYCAAAFRCGVMLGCKCSLGVGAAAAELPLEGCCIDARCAQKWWHICFGGR